MNPGDFSIPQIDWSKWGELTRKEQRDISRVIADTIADAPLDVQTAILIALSKPPKEKKKTSARSLKISASQQAIIDEFQREHGDVNAAEVLANFRKRYDRPVRDDWQETRKALLIAAVEEVIELRAKGLPENLARDVVARRYRGISLGRSGSKKREVNLRIGRSVLYKAHKAGAHLPGGSPEALHLDFWLCGRRRKTEA